MTENGYRKLLHPDGNFIESGTDIECIWFLKGDKNTGNFHHDTLIKKEIE